MIKQLLNLVIVKNIVIDQLPTDKSQYFSQPRSIIAHCRGQASTHRGVFHEGMYCCAVGRTE